MICSIRIEIKLKYVVIEVTRPGKDRFSVREWGFKLFHIRFQVFRNLKKNIFYIEICDRKPDCLGEPRYLKLETEHDKSLICFGMVLNKRIPLNLKL